MSDYIWSIGSGGIVNGDPNMDSVGVIWSSPGFHTIYIQYTTQNGCETSTSFDVFVNDPLISTITGDDISVIDETKSYITETGMYNYLWITSSGGTITLGQETNEVNVLWSGIGSQWIKVEYDNSDGCHSVSPNFPVSISPSICLITVDTITERNKLIWNTVGDVIHYNIYKEVQTEIYELISEVNSGNEFVDTTANPLVKSYRYKLSVTNTNSVESPKSPLHKTIHLSINLAQGGGYNLIWSHYQGFNFAVYKINRKIANGQWEVLDSVPRTGGDFESYTDFYLGTENVTYFIEVIRPEPCIVITESEISSVTSNKVTNLNIGIDENKYESVSIYPNPVTDNLTIDFDNIEYRIVNIFNGIGKKVYEIKSNYSRLIINVNNLPKGSYIMNIIEKQKIFYNKFIKL